MKGKITFLSPAKGHGLIRPDDGTEDVFFNVESTGKERFKALSVGSAVEYEVVPSQGFNKASNVRFAKKA